MHLKVFLKLKKNLKPSLLGKKTQKNQKKQKKTKKNKKKQKNLKKPTGLGFFKKTRVFSNPVQKVFTSLDNY
jgi:hypothetical protein